MASLRTLAFVLLVFLVIGCAGGDSGPSIVQGAIKLPSTDVIRLDGPWRFHPNTGMGAPGSNSNPEALWVKPGAVDLKVPGGWDRVQSAVGRGTYQIRLTDLTPGLKYALEFKGIATKANIWADQDEMGSWGAGFNLIPQMYEFQAKSPHVLITVSVENEVMATGGLWLPVIVGTERAVEKASNESKFFDLLLFGGLLMMGFYHLALYVFRPKDRATLYFGLFCLVSVFHSSLTGERLLAYEWMDFPQLLGMRLQYLASIAMPIFFMAYLQALFPSRRYKWLMAFIALMALYQGVVTVFFSVAQMQSGFWPYQAVILVVCLQVVTVLFTALRRRTPGAKTMLMGFLVIVAAATNDILHTNKVIETFYSLNMGLIVFLFTQAVIMGSLFSKSFKKVEELNETLELRVADRTKELEILSRSDALTGLMNRRHFWTVLTQEWERWNRYHHDFSLVMVDIDRFKSINDKFNHSAGDEALKQVARTLQHNVRKSDAVSRYGGEEFCLLLPGITAPEAFTVMEKIRQALEDDPFVVAGTRRVITLSYGIVQASRHPTPEAALDAADRLMYQAKKAGRNQGVVESAPDPGSGTRSHPVS